MSLSHANTSWRPKELSTLMVLGKSRGSMGSTSPIAFGAASFANLHWRREAYNGMGAEPAGDWKVTASGAKIRAKSSGSFPSQMPAARAVERNFGEKSHSSVGASGTCRKMKLFAIKAACPLGKRIAAQTDFETPGTPPTTWKIQASPWRSATVRPSPPSSKATFPSASTPKLHSPIMGQKPYSSDMAPMVSTAQRAVSHRSIAICMMFDRSSKASTAGRWKRGSPSSGARPMG
mmetsp:Transcript_119746/g.235411  ORF Transcript_119746/g.235411 Transcript_119746/m.235411 type:complete len:234 (+) Transcript_119746:183-884(+)